MPTGSVPNAYTCGSPGTHEDLVRATALGAAVSRARPGGPPPAWPRWPGRVTAVAGGGRTAVLGASERP